MELKTDAIIINYNGEKTILSCINSLRLHGLNGRIIVYDNGSNDGSIEVLKSIPGITLLRDKDNRGYSYAVNRASEISETDLFFVMNHDVEVVNGSLSKMAEEVSKKASVGVAGPEIIDENERLFRSPRRFPTLKTILIEALLPKGAWFEKVFYYPCDLKKERGYVEWVSGCFLLIKKRAFLDAGGFDERFFMFMEEVDFMKRLKEKGWKCLYYPEIIVKHYGGKYDDERKIIESYRSTWLFFDKHLKRKSLKVLSMGILVLRAIIRLFLWTALIPIKPKEAIPHLKGNTRALFYLFSSGG